MHYGVLSGRYGRVLVSSTGGVCRILARTFTVQQALRSMEAEKAHRRALRAPDSHRIDAREVRARPTEASRSGIDAPAPRKRERKTGKRTDDGSRSIAVEAIRVWTEEKLNGRPT